MQHRAYLPNSSKGWYEEVNDGTKLLKDIPRPTPVWNKPRESIHPILTIQGTYRKKLGKSNPVDVQSKPGRYIVHTARKMPTLTTWFFMAVATNAMLKPYWEAEEWHTLPYRDDHVANQNVSHVASVEQGRSYAWQVPLIIAVTKISF